MHGKPDLGELVRQARSLLLAGDASGCANLLSCLRMPGPDACNLRDARLWAVARDLFCQASFKLGKPEAGLEALENGCAFYRDFLQSCQTVDPADMLLLANLLQNLCFARLEQKLFEDALDAGEKAVAVARTYAPEKPETAEALFRLSAVYYRQKDLQKARQLTLEALEIWQRANAHKMAGECLNNLGRIYEEMGQNAAGIAWHEQAVALRRKLPDRQDLAFSLGNLGVARAANGDWRQALANLGEAVRIYEQLGLADCSDCKGFRANLEICESALF